MTAVCFSLFSYGLLFFTLAKIPDKTWDILLRIGPLSLAFIETKKSRWPLIGEADRGKKLLVTMSECEAKISLGIKILPSHIPKYKFYTSLLEQLFLAHRTLGIGIKKCFPEIRSALIRDLQFEKKLLDELISGFLQILVIGATTWSFVFLSSHIADIPLSKKTLYAMLALQMGGIFLFLAMVKKLKKKTFFKFSKAIEELYLFRSLIEIGLPLNDILKRSQILTGSFMSFKLFMKLSERLKKLVERLKETGMSPRDETQEIILEIWHLQEEKFHQFTKIVQILKFSILVFFFLPAYFLYLYSIFQFFMEQ